MQKHDPVLDLFGAHAAVAGIPLLTRDTGRYATYFPTLKLIVPTRGRTVNAGLD